MSLGRKATGVVAPFQARRENAGALQDLWLEDQGNDGTEKEIFFVSRAS